MGIVVIAMVTAMVLIPGYEAPAGASISATRWDYVVVSTPDFTGAFRGNDPRFRPPVPVSVAQPSIDTGRNGLIALLEVIVGFDGRARVERVLETSGPQSQRRIRAVVNRWRFQAARLDGKAIRVRLRVTVHNPDSQVEGLDPVAASVSSPRYSVATCGADHLGCATADHSFGLPFSEWPVCWRKL